MFSVGVNPFTRKKETAALSELAAAMRVAVVDAYYGTMPNAPDFGLSVGTRTKPPLSACSGPDRAPHRREEVTHDPIAPDPDVPDRDR